MGPIRSVFLEGLPLFDKFGVNSCTVTASADGYRDIGVTPLDTVVSLELRERPISCRSPKAHGFDIRRSWVDRVTQTDGLRSAGLPRQREHARRRRGIATSNLLNTKPAVLACNIQRGDGNVDQLSWLEAQALDAIFKG